MTTYISKGISYENYQNLLDGLIAEGKTTGENQTEDFLNYAKLNLARMHRLNKTAALIPEVKEALLKVKSDFVFLILTEGWCGDAAQNIPVIHLVEKECEKIELKLLQRDENLELMDRYLTDGGRSIPKLICLDKRSLKEVFVWGPRPAAVQELMLELKSKNATLAEKGEVIHKWYNTDKTLSLQKELLVLIEKHLC